MTRQTKDWFTLWFNTPFYHILYKDRDDKEAQSFMETLTSYLNIAENGTILDLACGKGRHAVYLNSIGYHVTGIDLSPESIAFAKQFENDRLVFDEHDMSTPYSQKFNAIFNLFTSFGFFEDENDNLNTIKSIKANLKDNGVGVIDFMNVDYVVKNLVADDVKTIEGIDFHLSRYIDDGYIIKDISFQFEGIPYHFKERVKAFRLEDFEAMFKAANIQLLDVFGDYKLKSYHKHDSERLIMIFM